MLTAPKKMKAIHAFQDVHIPTGRELAAMVGLDAASADKGLYTSNVEDGVNLPPAPSGSVADQIGAAAAQMEAAAAEASKDGK